MVPCKKIVAELSNYLSGDVPDSLRLEIEHHLSHCRRCSVLYDSIRKVYFITGDDRTFEVPAGYSERLHAFIDEHVLQS